MKQPIMLIPKGYLFCFGLICLTIFFSVCPAGCLAPTLGFPTKGANIPANQLLAGSSARAHYWVLPEPDYTWKALRASGVTVVQVSGGTEGNILHIQMNENHPYGRAYDPDWARNLEKLLAKADSYGMRLVFHTMGSTYGTLMGIVAPMHNYQRRDHYTSLRDTLALIDKLGGNNELGKNFVSDPRIAHWSPINEARLDYADIRDWVTAVLRRIKHYGGKTSVCVNDGEHRYVDSFPYIIPIIGDYVDFLQAHSYHLDIVESVGSKGPSANMYVPIYEAFLKDCKSMVNGRGSFRMDQLILTEFGCGSGAWRSQGRNFTTTEQQQADYVKAVLDACREYGITRFFYHEPINFLSDVRTHGFVNYDGSLGREPYNVFRSGPLMPSNLPASTVHFGEEEASGTIYIRPDGSVDPSTAPIRRDGNLYILTNDVVCDSILIMKSNISIDGNGFIIHGTALRGSGFSLSFVRDVAIRNARIQGFRNGFYLESAPNNTLSGNQLANNTYGIYIEHSSNGSILENEILSNEYGIETWYSSNVTIQANAIVNNKCGVRLWASNSSKIFGNDLAASSQYGIELVDSSYNSILENGVKNNWDGIYLSSSFNNTFIGNYLNNNFRGIFLYGSSNNTIYHNGFLHNTEQVHDDFWNAHYPEPSLNTWNNDYPSGGNYWSDYDSIDVYSGSYQNETGSDGIGDTHYIIDLNNTDYYPLMSPLDASSPIIHVTSPENRTYATRDIPLIFTVNEVTSWVGFSLDGQTNQTVNGSITMSDLSEGSHSVIVYAKDIVGNIGTSDMIHFSVETSGLSWNSLSVWFIAGAALVVFTITAALVYFTKVRRAPRKSSVESVASGDSVA